MFDISKFCKLVLSLHKGKPILWVQNTITWHLCFASGRIGAAQCVLQKSLPIAWVPISAVPRYRDRPQEPECPTEEHMHVSLHLLACPQASGPPRPCGKGLPPPTRNFPNCTSDAVPGKVLTGSAQKNFQCLSICAIYQICQSTK